MWGEVLMCVVQEQGSGDVDDREECGGFQEGEDRLIFFGSDKSYCLNLIFSWSDNSLIR